MKILVTGDVAILVDGFIEGVYDKESLWKDVADNQIESIPCDDDTVVELDVGEVVYGVSNVIYDIGSELGVQVECDVTNSIQPFLLSNCLRECDLLSLLSEVLAEAGR